MNRLLLLLVLGFGCIFSDVAHSATIFESGTIGPTGIPLGDVVATNVDSSVFIGVRFKLTDPVLTSQIGGHFVDQNNGTFFGAIVQLDDENDFPDSRDLSTDDVLGNAELTFPVPSAEVYGDLSISLDPGWFALVFGSGLFETSGVGAAQQNNSDIGDPSYIAHGPNLGWFDPSGFPQPFDNYRFVVNGKIVPEPSTILLAIATFSCFACKRLRIAR